jgi:hypothetical protein
VSPKPWQPFRVGDPVTLTTNFTDPGSNDTPDRRVTRSWAFGRARERVAGTP